MKYYVVVQAPAYSLSAERCAVESAFAVHLRTLRQLIGPGYAELVLIGPGLSDAEYLAAGSRLEVLEVDSSGIRFLPAFALNTSRVQFLLHRLLPTWRWLKQRFAEPCVVHSGMSTELARPLMFMASLAAKQMGRPVVFMVDMDFREHARRFYRTGQWSLKSYLVNRIAYDPLKWLQLRLAPYLFDVCCFKGATLVRDFGRGRSNVRRFYDTVHSVDDVLTHEQLVRRSQWIENGGQPFTVTYFGRLAANKGIDRMIAATRLALGRGANVRLRIIGDGECRQALVEQVRDQALEKHVEFLPAVAYGRPLFGLLTDCHICMAAPLIEDTPRAAFDAFSRGLPIVAFDIAYFRDLGQESGAVVTTPWPEVAGLADAIVQLAADRSLVSKMSRCAVRFATENTQEIWLKRRLEWLKEVVAKTDQ